MLTWDAEDYACNSTVQFEWAQQLIGRLALRDDDALLDIGCGDGRIDALLAGRVARGRVVGIDASADMIRLASERFPPSRHPNLSFVQMDARRIRLPGTFQVAFSNAALHWVDDHEAMLRGVRACLAPGGQILFQMGGRGNAAGILAVVWEVTRAAGWRESFAGLAPAWHFHGPEDYREWLPRCGFRPERLELLPRDMRYRDTDGLRGWLRSTWLPFTERLPPARRESFLDDAVRAYVSAYPPDADGTIHVAMVRLEVEAAAV